METRAKHRKKFGLARRDGPGRKSICREELTTKKRKGSRKKAKKNGLSARERYEKESTTCFQAVAEGHTKGHNF